MGRVRGIIAYYCWYRSARALALDARAAVLDWRKMRTLRCRNTDIIIAAIRTTLTIVTIVATSPKDSRRSVHDRVR